MLYIYEKQETEAPLILTIDQEGGGGLTGQAPTVALRDATTLDSYMEFAAGPNQFEFSTGPWTTKYFPMSEVERGHYTVLLDFSLITDIAVGSVLAAEYHLDGGVNIKGDDHDLILIVESLFEIPTTTAALVNALGTGLTPEQATWLQEVWQIHGLDITNPLTVSKTARQAGSAISQTIEKNVPIAGSCRVTRL